MTTAVHVFACFLASAGAIAAERTTAVASGGETVVRARVHARDVEIRIRTHEVEIGKPSDPPPDVREPGCTYSRYPCSRVDGLDITVDGTKVEVPGVVLFALADPDTA